MNELSAPAVLPILRCWHAGALLSRLLHVGDETRPVAGQIYLPCQALGLPCPWCNVCYCDAHQEEHLAHCVARVRTVPL